MANYNKSFSFKNGVQVDDKNFIVNTVGLVGIGTTIPTESLDVRGTIKTTGVVTATNFFSTGITTVNSLRVGTGVTISGGIITATNYYGDGSTLSNLPTSQWVDIDVGLGFTSIYNIGNVGIATDDPRNTLQVGSNPNSNGRFGVGINSNGNARFSGIVTASAFSGSGAGVTSLDASNLSSGTVPLARIPTLTNDKLPSIISIGGSFAAQEAYFIGTVRSSTGGFIGSFTGNLVGNTLGIHTGDVVGIASTARGLIGTPNIQVGIITASSGGFTGIVTANSLTSYTTLSVGASGTVFNVANNGNIGIGTSIPSSEFQIRRSNTNRISAEFINTQGQSRLAIGQVVGFGASVGIIKFGETAKTFELINNDTGNFNLTLHDGPAGVGTGRFAWIYGQDNTELMSLTYGGRLGLGITNPANTLHVVGTSTVTSNSFVGGNIEILGSITYGNGTNKTYLPVDGSTGVLNQVNLFVTSGITTTATILVGVGESIGVGTDKVITDIDARGKDILVGRIGVATGAIPSGAEAYMGGDLTVQNSCGINTSRQWTDPTGYDSGILQVHNGSLRLTGGSVLIQSFGALGIGSLSPIAAFDMRNASVTSTIRSPMIPPVMTTAQRNAITAQYLTGGALIYNSSLNRLELYNGSAWVGIATL